MVTISRRTTYWYQVMLMAAGVIACVRGVISLYQPDFWSPTSPLDYAAVVFTSLTFLSLALGLGGFLLHQLRLPGKVSAVWRFSMILACLSAGVIGLSNFLEDALSIRWLGWVWVVGFILVTLSLFVVGVSAFWVKGLPRINGSLLLISSAGVLLISTFGFFIIGFSLFALGLLEVRRSDAKNEVAKNANPA